MERLLVILIRTFIGCLLFLVGLLCVGQGLYVMADMNFPAWHLIAASAIGFAAGLSLFFVSWKLLSSTLRIPQREAA